MDVHEDEVHRSKVKVTRPKKCDFQAFGLRLQCTANTAYGVYICVNPPWKNDVRAKGVYLGGMWKVTSTSHIFIMQYSVIFISNLVHFCVNFVKDPSHAE